MTHTESQRPQSQCICLRLPEPRVGDISAFTAGGDWHLVLRVVWRELGHGYF